MILAPAAAFHQPPDALQGLLDLGQGGRIGGAHEAAPDSPKADPGTMATCSSFSNRSEKSVSLKPVLVIDGKA